MIRIQTGKTTEWTPFHTRVIASRVGDGTMNSAGGVSWANKHYQWMVRLSSHIDAPLGKPCIDDGTAKLTIPAYLVKWFGRVVGGDGVTIMRNCEVLLRVLSSMGFDHRIQALAALIVDDGECGADMMTLFESQYYNDACGALTLWESTFGTGHARLDDKVITAKGTRMYHVYVHSDGIMKFGEAICCAVEKHGDIAGLWFKHDKFLARLARATNSQATKNRETRNKTTEWMLKVLIAAKGKPHTFSEIQNVTCTSRDTTRTLVKKMIFDGTLATVGRGKRTVYVA